MSEFSTVHKAKGGVVVSGVQRWGRSEQSPKFKQVGAFRHQEVWWPHCGLSRTHPKCGPGEVHSIEELRRKRARKNQMFFNRISAETFQALLSDYRYLENEIHYYYGENFLKIIYIFLLKTKGILFENWIQMKALTDISHTGFRISMENLTIPAMLQVSLETAKFSV